jgi:excisionase family DNA binding protein
VTGTACVARCKPDSEKYIWPVQELKAPEIGLRGKLSLFDSNCASSFTGAFLHAMKEASMNSHLSVEEAAPLLKLSEYTTREWCRKGVIKNAFKIRKSWLIPVSEIERLLNLIPESES